MENRRPVRLTRSSDFLKIKQEGRRKPLNSWLLLTYRKNDLGYTRFGCTISGKVGNAVVRNRLKRWTRECFQNMAAHEFSSEYDFNLVFRPMAKDFYKKLHYEDFAGSLEEGLNAFKKSS